jgi:predicted transcriptional regulator
VATRVNVTLDEEYAEKLRRLAEQTYMQEGTLARSLLSRALDEADVDATTMVELLDGIPGALERARLGLEQARRGETIPLDEL